MPVIFPSAVRPSAVRRFRANSATPKIPAPSVRPSPRLAPSFLIAVLLLLTPCLWAQKDTGSIAGTVKDPGGAVVPNASITVTDVERGTKFTTQSSSAGEYVASPLKVGRYVVTVEHPGFKQTASQPIDLDIQQRIVFDVVLQLGERSETVEVTAAAPLLEAETSELGEVIDNKRVENLPLNGRNFAQLALMSAGTAPAEPGSRDEQSFGFSSNGARSLQNNFLLDGIDNNSNLPDLLNETNYVIQPSVEALQEFKVQTNAYTAEFGRGNGAIINATIKSGTNQLHGSVYEFLRNEKLDARNFFDPKKIPPYKQNQFGATLGGPVFIPGLYDGRNRTFFFVDYSGLRIRKSQTITALLPTLAQRAGDFSNLIDYSTTTGTDCNGRPTFAGEIFDARLAGVSGGSPCGVPFGYDPASGRAVNVIPATNPTPGGGQLDPLALRLAALYPAPNVANNPAFNYQGSPVLVQNRNNYDVRLDNKFSEADNGFFRYSAEDQPSTIPGTFPGIADGGGFFSGVEDNSYHSVALSETHIITPTLANEFRFGYNRVVSKRFNFFADKNISAQVGFPGVPFSPGIGGLPQLTFSDFPSATLGSPTFLPSKEIQNAYVVTDNVTWVRAKHTFKFGTELRREEFTIFQPANPRGSLSFGTQFTDNPANLGTGGSGFATFMAGLPTGGAINNLKNVDYFRQAYSFYTQDDWKITPKLTLNLGLRYELFTSVKERHNQLGSFDLTRPLTPTIIVPKGQTAQLTPLLASQIKIEASGSPGLVRTDLNNFAPRIGFALKVSENTVVRSGYGIFYGGQESGPYSNPSPGFNPPFFVTQSFSTPCSVPSANPALASQNLDCAIPDLRYLNQGFPANSLTNPNTPILFSVDKNLRTPYMQQWHLSVQRELPGNTVAEVTYAGSKGTKLYTFFNGNQAAATPDPTIPNAPRRPIPSIDSGINWFRSTGFSNYNSLQLRAEKRFSRGFTLLTTYTWAHSIDNASNANLGAQNNSDFRDFRFPQLEHGNSDFDVRHRMVFSYIYELPFGRGKRFGGDVNGAVNQIIGGWSVAGITSLSSGNWFTLTDANGNFANSDGGVSGVSQRPNQVGNPHVKPCVPGTFFNTCAFVNPPLGSFGNVNRNSLQGPGYQIWDMSLFKTFKIAESKQLELRSEFFNFPNHTNKLLAKSGPQQGNSSTVLGASNFGFLTAARDPRQIQFALKFSF